MILYYQHLQCKEWTIFHIFDMNSYSDNIMLNTTMTNKFECFFIHLFHVCVTMIYSPATVKYPISFHCCIRAKIKMYCTYNSWRHIHIQVQYSSIIFLPIGTIKIHSSPLEIILDVPLHYLCQDLHPWCTVRKVIQISAI